ncbi:MAG: ammonium transporter, partial [Desulfomicrobiaceae bacterium]|nr:ammonium transporter [Desulfomicrobiaceae bacterium]
LVSVVATWVFCFLMSYVLFKVIDATLGLRVSPEDETRGLDVNEHRETGYQW